MNILYMNKKIHKWASWFDLSAYNLHNIHVIMMNKFHSKFWTDHNGVIFYLDTFHDNNLASLGAGAQCEVCKFKKKTVS